VTSSANIANVNASGQENFTAGNLASSCSASETGVSGSTTITAGTLVTDNGDSDPTNSIPDHPPVTEILPASPAPNTTYAGHVHIGNMTDSFRWVFNEQTINADGSFTVNAGHQSLLGPSATGNLILGQVVCGVTAGAPPPPPPSPGARSASGGSTRSRRRWPPSPGAGRPRSGRGSPGRLAGRSGGRCAGVAGSPRSSRSRSPTKP